ncbi:MAG: tetraacyldisaccharide 4'-kinase [Burkholderiales bacterium]
MEPTASRWADRLQALWWQPAPPPWPLRLPAALFTLLVRLRHWLYRHRWLRTEHLRVPVIVVGNRIVGGAGKTPVTVALIEALRAAGWRPGVVSRGHGRHSTEVRRVTVDSPAHDVGDEPLLLARRTHAPVWVGRDRVQAAQALLAAEPGVNVLVCDDGLQHLRLGRDLELIVFDARGAGNGHLLPAGPLREPLHTPSTARHHWVLYNAPQPSTPLPGWTTQRGLAGLVPLAGWWADEAAQADSFALLADLPEPVWAVAGIGSPQRFFDDLAARGLHCHAVPLADHHDFDALPWPTVVCHVVVTEKDAVKLDPARIARERPGCSVWVAPLALTLPPALLAALLQAVGPPHRPAQDAG